ncbi:hypothetical protein GCM10029992_55200 [Glycomyces albus]
MAYMQPQPYFPPPRPPQGPKERPPHVAAAVSIQFALAAVLAAAGVAGLAASGTVREEATRWIESDPETNQAATEILGGFFGAVLVLEGLTWIVWAACHAVLGILNFRGKRPARILSWIQSGLSLTGCGLGSLTGQIGFRYTYSDPSGDRTDEFTDAMARATPDWASAMEFVALIVLLLGSLAVILLLVSKEANQFFYRPKPYRPVILQYTYLPQDYQSPNPYGRPPQGPPEQGRPPGPEA